MHGQQNVKKAALVKISGIKKKPISFHQTEQVFIKNQVVAASFGSH